MTARNGQLAVFMILVDASSISRSTRGQIAGPIHVELAGRAFPEPDWSDSVVAVLHSWVENVLRLRRNEVSKVQLYFMDGPFRIGIANEGNNGWRIDCWRADSVNAQMSGHCDAAVVAGALSSATEAVLHECARRDWKSADLVELAMMTPKLVSE